MAFRVLNLCSLNICSLDKPYPHIWNQYLKYADTHAVLYFCILILWTVDHTFQIKQSTGFPYESY